MLKKLLLGGLLGGLVLFMYLGLSWAVLPFHMNALHELPAAAAMGGGLAGLDHRVYYSGMPEEGATDPAVPLMVFAPDGYEPQPVVMGRGLVLTLLATFLVTFIVMASRQTLYSSRVVLCTIVGAVVALAGPMTFGNFFYFPFEFVWPEIVDQLLGWTLAGLVIAWAARPDAEPADAAGA